MLVALVRAGVPAAAAPAPPAPPQATARVDCKPRPVQSPPLALTLTPQGVDPAVPLQFAVPTGPCAGSERIAPSSLPFSADYPYPASWWSGGAHPFTPYRGA
ncbi:MAG: hypothetical protein ACREMT_02720 [Vulcanimicrobiaceae bacterium]